MSDITKLTSAADALSLSEKGESELVEQSLAAVINTAAKCGQTSAVFSTKLTDEQLTKLEGLGYTVVKNGPDIDKTPQYIISWKSEEE